MKNSKRSETKIKAKIRRKINRCCWGGNNEDRLDGLDRREKHNIKTTASISSFAFPIDENFDDGDIDTYMPLFDRVSKRTKGE